MNTSNQNETAPSLPPTTVEQRSDREVAVTRSFDSPVTAVFEAWANPDLFRRWWVPRSMGVALESCEMDVRTGGTYKLGFGGGMDFFGRYLDVEAPLRIVWTNDEGEEGGSVTTVTLTEADGGTRLVVSECFASEDAFEAGSGAADAMPEVFSQLDEILVELAQKR